MMQDDKKTPRPKAVALRYTAEDDHAPKIVAKGSGLLADRIMELAREHDVPIHEDPDLVGLLAKLEVGVEIPDNMYRAVAEVLAFVYRLNTSRQS